MRNEPVENGKRKARTEGEGDERLSKILRGQKIEQDRMRNERKDY